MLSRIAESLYWIGRYVERAEQTARLTEVTFGHTLTMGSTPAAREERRRQWEALLDVVGERAAFAATGLEADAAHVPSYVTFADENPNSIIACIAAARENARTMRHQLATETWEVLNRFHFDVQRPARRRRAAQGPEAATRFCRSVTEFGRLFSGVADATMPREEGWWFLNAGRYLERADRTARLLEVNVRLLLGEAGSVTPGQAPLDPQPWATVLRALSAYEAYYRVSSASVHAAGVIELLVLSPAVPRSIRFSVSLVAEALRQIAADGRDDGGEAHREVARLDGELAYQRLADLERHGVQRFLGDVQRRCWRIGEEIEEQYFAHRALTAEQVMA